MNEETAAGSEAAAAGLPLLLHVVRLL